MIKMWIYRMKDATVDLLHFLAVFSLLSLVCATTPELAGGETIGQWVWFGKAACFSAGCFVVAGLLQLWGADSWKEAFFFSRFFVNVAGSLILLGGIEAAWGLHQLYGFSASGHSRYALTGSFFNPGPYAGYLAMVLPLCLHRYMWLGDWRRINAGLKLEKMITGVAGTLILCVLPATMSRSAWVAALVGCGWVMYMHRDRRKWSILWRRYKKRYVWYGMALLCLLVMGGVGAFFLKPDSALGRLFLWKITCKAIALHPLGCDKGFAFAYGEAQEAYFAQGNYAGWEERVAGSPEYAFNEYLELILVEGPFLFMALVGIVWLCLWQGVQLGRYGICGAVLSLLVFSFSSYPMHLPAFMVACPCLLLACVSGDMVGKPAVLSVCLVIWIGGWGDKWRQEEEACRHWMNARMLYHSGAYDAANKAYDKLYPYLRKRGAFLFDYGHSLHKAGSITNPIDIWTRRWCTVPTR